MTRSARTRTAVLALAGAVVTILPLVPGARAAVIPSLRLYAGSSEVTLYRYGDRVPLELGTYVTPVGGDFEVRVRRPDPFAVPEVAQLDPVTGEVLRTIPGELLRRIDGFAKFARITIRNTDGTLAARRWPAFCPNGYHERVSDAGSEVQRYPDTCGGSLPFLRGMIWGIEDHWAASLAGDGYHFGAPSVRLAPGRYTATVKITPAFVDLFAIAPEHTTVTLGVVVEDASGFRERYGAAQTAAVEAAAEVPTVTDPDPSTLPDVAALPAWSLEAFSFRRADHLSFATTLWNAGPAPLVVEGFRRQDEDVMDAYQYFRDPAGNVVGRAPVGVMRFDARRGHTHWHFLQFARFSLIDPRTNAVVRSKKQAFCIIPTDAVDLTVERADWRPWNFNTPTQCGGPSSIWVRESLQAGWGDTYYQWQPGQSFRITDLRNGWYKVKIEVNPTGELYDRDPTNNVEWREVYLGGKPGARFAVAAPWNGIDA